MSDIRNNINNNIKILKRDIEKLYRRYEKSYTDVDYLAAKMERV